MTTRVPLNIDQSQAELHPSKRNNQRPQPQPVNILRPLPEDLQRIDNLVDALGGVRSANCDSLPELCLLPVGRCDGEVPIVALNYDSGDEVW